MSIIFSRQCEYALQAVIYLASQPRGELMSIRKLARELTIPYHYLAKILQSLAAKGLLHSQRGPSGGFSLAMQPARIRMRDIVEAIDGLDLTNKCVLGFKECGTENPCAVHHQWRGIREAVNTLLTDEHLGRVARKPSSRRKQH